MIGSPIGMFNILSQSRLALCKMQIIGMSNKCITESGLTPFRHVAKFAGVKSFGFHQFDDPVSPHIAAYRARRVVGQDNQLEMYRGY